MAATIGGEVTTTRSLGRKETCRVLSAAVKARVRIQLDFEPQEGHRLRVGRLVLADGSRLTVELDGGPVRDREMLKSEDRQASFELGGGVYFFQTRLANANSDTDSDVIHVRQPDQIIAVERRRSLRRSLRGATELTIRSTESGQRWSCSTDLLNLSPDGLACRMRKKDATSAAVGRTLIVTGRIGPADMTLELTAIVVNATPAGTDDHVVLGLEFVDDERLELARDGLRAILSGDSE